MGKIHETNIGYSLMRFYADAFIHHSFRRYKALGIENIPSEGGIIFAPNHCDALMDPLAALALTGEKKVFVARADVFKKPVFQKILTFFKIMPINRRRDGLRSVIKTEETIRNSIEVLRHNVKFCIMPEGTHRPMHSLLPIGKGVARIACGADAILGDTPVYIVPVGLEYGDYYRFRSSLLLQVCPPINVSSYIREHPEKSEHDIMQDIRTMIADSLKEKIVFINDDDDYRATWELAKIFSGKIPASDLEGRFKANREAVSKIEKLKNENPGAAAALFNKVLAFTDKRKAGKVSINAVHASNRLIHTARFTAKALLLLPFFIVTGTFSLPLWGVAELLIGKMKDKVFGNSVRCGCLIILWAIVVFIWIVVLFCTMPWYMALISLLIIIPSPFYTYDYFETVRQCASAWRYLFAGKLKRERDGIVKDMERLLR